MSSFKRKTNIKVELPIGCQITTNNQLLVTSSGIKSLDSLLGGGYPIGSLGLVLQEGFTNYYHLVIQYYFSQAIFNKDGCYIVDANKFNFENLPGLYNYNKLDIKDAQKKAEEEKEKEKDNKLNIAWRYQNMTKVSSSDNDTTNLNNEKENQLYCYNFDLSTKINLEKLNETQIYNVQFDKDNLLESLKGLKELLVSEYSLKSELKLSKRKVLRIVINNLGHPTCDLNTDPKVIYKFIYLLKRMVRNSLATAIVTLPSSTLNPQDITSSLGLADYAFRFKPFLESASELNSNEYTGLFELLKPLKLNSLTPATSKLTSRVEVKVGGSCQDTSVPDLGFKVKRKGLQIDSYHLPIENSFGGSNTRVTKPKKEAEKVDAKSLEF